jgi:hypothetical protein
MTAPRFSVHVNPDDLARQDFAAALTHPATPGAPADHPTTTPETGHHGARDTRQASRGRSERDHSRVSAGKSRSYAFRRS